MIIKNYIKIIIFLCGVLPPYTFCVAQEVNDDIAKCLELIIEKENTIKGLQTQNDSLETEKKNLEQQLSEKDNIIEGLQTQNDSLETEKKNLEQQLSEKEDTIEGLQTQNDSLTTLKETLEQQLSEREDTIMCLKGEKNVATSKYDNLVSTLMKLDAIVYKQCLLYPLESRFNEAYKNESLQIISEFSKLPIGKSNKFEENCRVYEPLLKQYEKYNNELISFFETKMRTLKSINWVIGSGHQNKFKDELKDLSYYRDCYSNKDKPPYKSILYLDDAIDKFIKILEKGENVKQDMEDLISSLKP